MKWTKSLIQTLRENPGDAEIDSHRLLMRAGLARKVAGGLYAYLPLGMRSLKKIMEIVREEMDRAGALEIVSPILQPAELWRTTGRWDTMGPNMFKLRDRGEHEFALGPTAEEVFTDLAKSLVSSYRQLPVTIYQIQWKFRDETRPRFGLMRSKEFLMKDAYSFDTDAEGADKSYWNMYHAYERIYARCGLKAVPVQADGGDMGDSMTHEFHVLADAGEDGIAFCDGCGYAANLEKAERRAAPCADADCPAHEEVATPNAKTIEEVASFLGLPADRFVKSLVYVADGKPVMVCVQGDRDVNEVKLKRFLGAKSVALADFGTVLKATGANAGFVGPVAPADASLKIVADIALKGAKGRIVGANKDDFHLKNVDLARDAKIADADYADLVIVKDGDICAKCGKQARHRGRAGLQARHEVLRRVQRRLQERQARRPCDDHGLLRRRRFPHAAGGHRAMPRQGRHNLARVRSAVPGHRRKPRSRQARRDEDRGRSRICARGGWNRRNRRRPR